MDLSLCGHVKVVLSCGLCLSGVCVFRLLEAYNARIADEGEYDEQELPASMVDELEGAAGPARQVFAVRHDCCGCL